MTEADIRGHVLALIGAVQTNDEKTALTSGLALASQMLVDLNRCANALERLATKDTPAVPISFPFAGSR